ncbi:MAG: DUF5134 domain-containing protein [Solirubrobacterales bacterium]
MSGGMGMKMSGGGSMMSGSHGSMSMGGMTMAGAGHGATNILPDWVAVIWTLVFIAIIAIELRCVIDGGGQRRFWHAGQLLIALGMAFMYAPSSIDHFNIPSGFWQLAFANGTVLIVFWMLAEALARRSINVLWLVLAIDLAAMAYLWSPSGFQSPLAWLLVAYFAAQSLLWASNRIHRVDRQTTLGGFSVSPSGAVTTTATVSLIGQRHLRVSMSAMMLGIAYMFLAMLLVL